MALAGPLPSTNSVLEGRSPSSQSSYITACEAADNCETYIDPTSGRTNIRFKAGMEPGTDDYNSRVANSKIKRQNGSPYTQVTLGDHTISWGCGIDPVATLGNVSSICATSGQCIPTDSWSTTVDFPLLPPENSKNSETLTITATGTYPSWSRNGLIEAVQAVMSAQGVITDSTVPFETETDSHPTGTRPPQKRVDSDDSCTLAQAPNYIGLGVYFADDALMSTFDVTITLQEQTNGFCSKFSSIAALTGAIAGAFGPIGADLAAIFGSISASCS
ncbi:hypothetical protein JMJ35_006737 [Cladonia borealis]|uniref:Uncharacterized protein n=1 Tax=Cladonia borealis TaxID=184061 RepID=A0AA39V7X9_9LECA|nr:hypothetical protein JMJ35_006737 [Cladonia borealis]